jgi:hypothetical protein
LAKRLDLLPGDRAPAAATYSLHNDFDNPTGLAAEFMEGESLAYAPRGFVWSLLISEANDRPRCPQIEATA